MSDNQHFSKHATGPRTQAGKAVSSRNAVKHHLTCANFRMTPGESQSEFDALQATLIEEHQPATITESLMIELMTKFYWLIQRAIRTGSREGCTESELSLMTRYQTAHDNSFHKALKSLKTLQAERKAEERGELELKLRKQQLDVAMKELKLSQMQSRQANAERAAKPETKPASAANAATSEAKQAPAAGAAPDNGSQPPFQAPSEAPEAA